jgi:hypothetical protein
MFHWQNRRVPILLAAMLLLFATTLAKRLGLAVKNALRLLDGLVTAGILCRPRSE